MQLSDLNQLLPLLNIIFVLGVIPLVKTLNTLNGNILSLCSRLDCLEREIKIKHEHLESDVKNWVEKLERHLDYHHKDKD